MSLVARFAGRIMGQPIATKDEHAQRISARTGLAVFGLDALSSAAYGPEAALTLLIPLGLMGSHYLLPITGAIIALLCIVFLSYRQTIQAYPGGGGSYSVAGSNLGPTAGLLAGAALIIDYTLNVAVGIAAGVGAIVSAVPQLQPHMTSLCIIILLTLALLNLRGVRDTGLVFIVPTYCFIAALFALIGIGGWHALQAHGHPLPVIPPPHLSTTTLAVPGIWLLLKAFASGCAALTGVEAVSNGVTAFQQPVTKVAKRSLGTIIGVLVMLLAGLAWLVHVYQVTASDPSQQSYQSVLSILLGAIAGRHTFYYFTMTSIVLVLCLSANTSYADFPRLCRVMALDRYLPSIFSVRGRRLVYTHGVIVLTVFAAALLIAFGGVTDRLIPLFAIGAFLAFTLSQAGMVIHWWKLKKRGRACINGIGALATGITILIVLAAKFTEGAWIIVVLIPLLCVGMVAIRRHYHYVATNILTVAPVSVRPTEEPVVIVPMDRWSRVSRKALSFAMRISPDVRALHVEGSDTHTTLPSQWDALVAEPARAANLPVPQLFVLHSPYRFIVQPILHFVQAVEQANPERLIAVVVPELVERGWYYQFLHNQRSAVIKTLLYLRGTKRVMVINVPWYVDKAEQQALTVAQEPAPPGEHRDSLLHVAD